MSVCDVPVQTPLLLYSADLRVAFHTRSPQATADAPLFLSTYRNDRAVGGLTSNQAQLDDQQSGMPNGPNREPSLFAAQSCSRSTLRESNLFFFDTKHSCAIYTVRQIAQNKIHYIDWDLAHKHLRAGCQHLRSMDR